MKDSWGYSELPKGMYSAHIAGAENRWMFRAYPNRGDYCVEGIFESHADALAAAEDWINGVKSPLAAKLYSACF